MTPAATACAASSVPSSKRPNPSLGLTVPSELVELIAQRAAELVAEYQQTAPEDTAYLTVAEAAEYLRCKPKRVYDLTGQRRLPFVKDGSRTLLRRADLTAYLEANRG